MSLEAKAKSISHQSAADMFMSELGYPVLGGAAFGGPSGFMLELIEAGRFCRPGIGTGICMTFGAAVGIAIHNLDSVWPKANVRSDCITFK